MDRSTIPAEMKRKVLVECGHRCAIPHCTSSEIDIHHIVPWEICEEHSPENLIGLCPNCHRRAHKGEIDRKALILYKLRGQRIFRGESTQTIGSTDPWSIRTFRDSRNDAIFNYEAEAEYPYFSSSEYSWADEVNVYVQAAILSAVQGLRGLANEAPWTWPPIEEREGKSSFGASFEVVFFRGGRLLSIRFSFFSYYVGASHPNHWTKTLNFFLNPVFDIELKHFFEGGVDYLGQLSTVVRQELLSRCGLSEGGLDPTTVLEGTEPRRETFSSFNVSDAGFLFNFDEYTVGPYSAGRQEVLIPFSTLSGLVLPEELITKSNKC